MPGETKFRDEAFGKLSPWIFRKDRGCSGALPKRRVQIPQALRLVLLEILSRRGVYGGDVGSGMAGIPILLLGDQGEIEKFKERGMMLWQGYFSFYF